MGQSFSIGDSEGKKEFCKGCSSLVSTVNAAVTDVVAQDAAHGAYIFKSPLTWTSGVSKDALSKINVNLGDEDVFTFNDGVVSVKSLEYLKRVLDAAESATDELALAMAECSEAPLTAIFGKDFATVVPRNEEEAGLMTALRTVDAKILLGKNFLPLSHHDPFISINC